MPRARWRPVAVPLAALAAVLGLPATATAADTNLAPTGTATASSVYSSLYAANNVNDGDPRGDPQVQGTEWASKGQKAGAWVRVTFDAPVTVDKAVFYDRPNGDDQVTKSRLFFDDGTYVSVGTLPDDGSPKTKTFPAKTTRYVEFLIRESSASTVNTGLAELELWGTSSTTPPPAACADGADNDGDGKVDAADPGCTSSTDTDETDPTTTNGPPSVSAGPDRSVTLPSSATLDGTVSDPDGDTVTTTWSKVSGPGTVTFGDPAAVDTTAAFSAAGDYVLQLSGSDGTNPAVTDRMSVAAAAEPTTPTGPVDFRSIGASRDYIMSLPTSGTQWQQVVSMAGDAYTVDTGDGATDGSGNAVAGALVYVRTGDTTYRDKVNAALDQVQATNPASWWHAAANRKMVGWVQAAELVGRAARNADGSLTAWGRYISEHTTVTHQAGPSRAAVMTRAAYGWDNNHGAAARASLAAIQAVLGDTAGLSKSCKAMQAFLGGSSADGTYRFVMSTNPGSNEMGITGGAESWYVSGNPAGIGLPGNGLRSGAIPSDAFREGATYPTIGAAGRDHYIAGNLMREVAAIGILEANGCDGLWEYASSAPLRAMEWIVANNVNVASPHNGAVGLIDDAYGRDFGSATSRGESYASSSHWLALGSGWAATQR